MKRIITFVLLLITSVCHAQTQICYDVGGVHQAVWPDYWKPGNPQLNYFYTNSFCPTWAGRLPASATKDGIAKCYAQAPLGAINPQAMSGYGHCRQPSNYFTEECLAGEACLVAMQYTNYSSICNSLVTNAINTWNAPTAIDCNNMNRKWIDNWGGVWYVAQANKSRTVTGWVDTSKAYDRRARCGWWRITGSVTDSGYLYVDINSQVPPPPRSVCNSQMAFSGTVTPSKASGSYLNQQGFTGVFELFSQEPPPGFTWVNWTPMSPLSRFDLPPWTVVY